MSARSLRLSLCLLVAAALAPAQPATAQLTPHFHGVGLDCRRDLNVVHLGFTNASGSQVNLPVEAQNFFSPPPANRGQATRFATGTNPTAIDLPLDAPTAPTGQLFWILTGNSVSFVPDSHDAVCEDGPANTTPPAVLGDARAGATVGTDRGAWTGAPAPQLSQRWQRSDDGGESWVDLDGADGSSLELDLALEGEMIRVLVSADNGVGTPVAAASEPVTVEAATPDDAVRWAGEWSDGQEYRSGSLVRFGGSSWIAAADAPAGAQPGDAEAWVLLAERGPQGDPGPSGPGTSPAAARRVVRLNRRGRARVADARVKPGSVVLTQYIGGRRPRIPTVVRRVRAGRFMVTGTPRARFTYVVFGA